MQCNAKYCIGIRMYDEAVSDDQIMQGMTQYRRLDNTMRPGFALFMQDLLAACIEDLNSSLWPL